MRRFERCPGNLSPLGGGGEVKEKGGKCEEVGTAFRIIKQVGHPNKDKATTVQSYRSLSLELPCSLAVTGNIAIYLLCTSSPSPLNSAKLKCMTVSLGR